MSRIGDYNNGSTAGEHGIPEGFDNADGNLTPKSTSWNHPGASATTSERLAVECQFDEWFGRAAAQTKLPELTPGAGIPLSAGGEFDRWIGEPLPQPATPLAPVLPEAELAWSTRGSFDEQGNPCSHPPGVVDGAGSPASPGRDSLLSLIHI